MPKAKKGFKTRDDALASLKAVSFVDEFADYERTPAGGMATGPDDEAIWIAKEVFPEVFAHPDYDRGLVMSAEDGGQFANYYGQFDEGCDPWVHPVIEAWAEQHDYIIEWRDPGSVTLFPRN